MASTQYELPRISIPTIPNSTSNVNVVVSETVTNPPVTTEVTVSPLTPVRSDLPTPKTTPRLPSPKTVRKPRVVTPKVPKSITPKVPKTPKAPTKPRVPRGSKKTTPATTPEITPPCSPLPSPLPSPRCESVLSLPIVTSVALPTHSLAGGILPQSPIISTPLPPPLQEVLVTEVVTPITPVTSPVVTPISPVVTSACVTPIPTTIPVVSTPLPVFTTNPPTISAIPVNFKMPSSLTKIPNTVDLEEANVEKKLASKGYVPLERILVHIPNKGTTGRYIKVVTERGQTALVHLDSEGLVPVRSSDLILVESTKPSSIPVSTKVGTLESAGLSITGIAFECQNGYCTMMRNPTSLEPQEVVLVTTPLSGMKEEVIILEDTPVPIPIIKYSEILQSSNSVIKAVDVATRRMRNNTFATCIEEMSKTSCAIKELDDVSKTYQENQMALFEKIKQQIHWLEKLQNDYCQSPPKDESERDKMSKIPLSLKFRFEKQVDQMILCGKFANQKIEISELMKKIREFNEQVVMTTKNLEYVYPK